MSPGGDRPGAGHEDPSAKPGSEEPGSEEPGSEEPGLEPPGSEDSGLEEPGAEVLAARLGAELVARGGRCATAESCTGGGIAWTCTAVAGASEWFECGFVTYTLAAKRSVLGVPAALLARHGAVSEPVARAMAEGARSASGSTLAMAVTGVAGPGGGDVLVPVGTVWFGWSLRGVPAATAVHRIDGNRTMVREMAVRIALRGALEMLGTRDA